MERNKTHLWIQFVDAPNCLFHSAILDCLADLHPLVDHVLINSRRDARFTSKFHRGIGKALDDEVVKDKRVEVTAVSMASTQRHDMIRNASI